MDGKFLRESSRPPYAATVDDDADLALAVSGPMRQLIEREKFTVAITHKPCNACRQIAMQQPNILLLDLRLPDCPTARQQRH